MRLPRLSLATAGFAILVIGLDLAVLRATFDLLFGNLAAWIAACLQPMVDILLISLYRLRRREARTPRAIGFLASGTIATGFVFAAVLLAPETSLLVIGTVLRPVVQIAVAIDDELTRHFGGAVMQDEALGLALGIGLEVLLPAVLLTTQLLLVALFGGWLARRLAPGAMTRRTGPASHPDDPAPALIGSSPH